MLVKNGALIPKNPDGMDMLPLIAMKRNKVPRTLYWRTDYTSAIMDGDAKYLLVRDRAPQLYDVVKDYREMDDLCPGNMEKAAPLARKLGIPDDDSRFPLSGYHFLVFRFDEAVRPCASRRPARGGRINFLFHPVIFPEDSF